MLVYTLRMKRMTLLLDRALLNRATRALGVTHSAAVNLALAEVLRIRKIQRLKLGFLAAGRSGHHDTAERAEELLCGRLAPDSTDSWKRTGKERKEPLIRR